LFQPLRLPHPPILLLTGVVLAAALTWTLPAGNFDRRDDPATGRRVVVAGTYHRVARRRLARLPRRLPSRAVSLRPRRPLADLLGLSRQVPVLAYQTGAGLMELATPTNGALMAVLVAAGVPFQRWIRFALGALMLATLLGIAGIAAAIWLRVA